MICLKGGPNWAHEECSFFRVELFHEFSISSLSWTSAIGKDSRKIADFCALCVSESPGELVGIRDSCLPVSPPTPRWRFCLNSHGKAFAS